MATPAELYAKHYLSLDIEMRGKDMEEHPVTAIGIFVGPVDRTSPLKKLELKRRWALKPLPGQVDEKDCVDNFWAKFPEVDQWIRVNALDATTVMSAFREQLLQLATLLGPKNLIFLTDCPDTDLARLDYLGKRTRTFKEPIRYLEMGIRHSQADPSERLAQLGQRQKELLFDHWMATYHPTVKHTHFPDDDAEHSYWMMQYCDQHRPRI